MRVLRKVVFFFFFFFTKGWVNCRERAPDLLQYGCSSVLYTPRASCMYLQVDLGHTLPSQSLFGFFFLVLFVFPFPPLLAEIL